MPSGSDKQNPRRLGAGASVPGLQQNPVASSKASIIKNDPKAVNIQKVHRDFLNKQSLYTDLITRYGGKPSLDKDYSTYDLKNDREVLLNLRNWIKGGGKDLQGNYGKVFPKDYNTFMGNNYHQSLSKLANVGEHINEVERYNEEHKLFDYGSGTFSPGGSVLYTKLNKALTDDNYRVPGWRAKQNQEALLSLTNWFDTLPQGVVPSDPNDRVKYEYVEFKNDKIRAELTKLGNRFKNVPNRLSKTQLDAAIKNHEKYSKTLLGIRDNYQFNPIDPSITDKTLANEQQLISQLELFKLSQGYKDLFHHQDLHRAIESRRNKGEELASLSLYDKYNLKTIQNNIKLARKVYVDKQFAGITAGLQKVAQMTKAKPIKPKTIIAPITANPEVAKADAYYKHHLSDINSIISLKNDLLSAKPKKIEDFDTQANGLKSLSQQLANMKTKGDYSLTGKSLNKDFITMFSAKQLKASQTINSELSDIDKLLIKNNNDKEGFELNMNNKNKSHLNLTGLDLDTTRREGFGYDWKTGIYHKLYDKPSAANVGKYSVKIRNWMMTQNIINVMNKPYGSLTDADKKQIKYFSENPKLLKQLETIDDGMDDKEIVDYIDYINIVEKRHMKVGNNQLTNTYINSQKQFRLSAIANIESNIFNYSKLHNSASSQKQIQKDVAGVNFDFLSLNTDTQSEVDKLDIYQLKDFKKKLQDFIVIRDGVKQSRRDHQTKALVVSPLNKKLSLENRIKLIDNRLAKIPFSAKEINESITSLAVIKDMEKRSGGFDKMTKTQLLLIKKESKNISDLYGKFTEKDWKELIVNKELKKKFKELLDNKHYLDFLNNQADILIRVSEIQEENKHRLKTDDYDADYDDDEINRWLLSMINFFGKGIKTGLYETAGMGGSFFNVMSNGQFSVWTRFIAKLQREGYGVGKELGENTEYLRRATEEFVNINRRKNALEENIELLERRRQELMGLLRQVGRGRPAMTLERQENIDEFRNTFGQTWQDFRDENDNALGNSPYEMAKHNLMITNTELSSFRIGAQERQGLLRPISDDLRHASMLLGSELNDPRQAIARLHREIFEVRQSYLFADRRTNLRHQLLARLRNLQNQVGRMDMNVMTNLRTYLTRERVRIQNNPARVEFFVDVRNMGNAIEGYYGGKLLLEVVERSTKFTTKLAYDLINTGAGVVYIAGQEILNKTITKTDRPIDDIWREKEIITKPPIIKKDLEEQVINPNKIDYTDSTITDTKIEKYTELIDTTSTRIDTRNEINNNNITIIDKEPKQENMGRTRIKEDMKFIPKTIEMTRRRISNLEQASGYKEESSNRIPRTRPFQSIKGTPLKDFAVWMTDEQIDLIKRKDFVLKKNIERIRKQQREVILNRPVGKVCCGDDKKYKDLIKVNSLF